LDPGTYKLTIKREGYETLEKIFTAKCGTSSTKIPLQPDHGEGRVRKQASGMNDTQTQPTQESQPNVQGAGRPRPTSSSKTVQLTVYDVRTYQPIPNITVKVNISQF
jgi:hypothetical protein